MASPLERISKILNISTIESRRLCEEIQKHFKGGPPKFKTIAKYIENNPGIGNNPDILATKMKETYMMGKYKYQNFPRSIKGKTSNLKTKRTQRQLTFKQDTGDYLSKSRPGDRPKPSQLEEGVERRSIFDYDRYPQDEGKKCPHGVPIAQICALCDPEKFRKMTGID